MPKFPKISSSLERWKNIGMFDAEGEMRSDDVTLKIMAEGNTLFMLGSGKAFTEDETEDSFGLMPYLSEDGTKNNFILNVSRYTGINKALEQNPQKAGGRPSHNGGYVHRRRDECA